MLVSVGRRPSTTGIDAAALGLNIGKRGEILVDDQMRTNLPNVYAIGDCVPGPMLAHKAEEEGVDRRRGDRRQAGAHALQVDPERRLHVAGDRVGRTHRAPGEGERPRVSDRQVPLLGQWTRALDGRESPGS